MKRVLLILLLLSSYIINAQTRNLRLVKSSTQNPTLQKRKAVVIGMSDYGLDRNLSNTLNDANDMATSLSELGFEVTLLKNNDLRNLKENLNKWYNSIEGNDIAVFYFAGHGMEVNGDNFLIPVDADMNSETDVVYNTLNVNQVLGNMDEKKVGMKLLILDACRDNPFKRSWTRGGGSKGLAQLSAPKGTYIAFAASPGFTAQDGGNYRLQNGVFTHYLKQEILKQGISIDEVFNNVTGSVANLTKNQQTPFKNSSLTKTFYFRPSDNIKPQATVNVKKYFYYIDENGNKSTNQFSTKEEASNEMKRAKKYGKILSSLGEVFLMEAPKMSDNENPEDNHDMVEIPAGFEGGHKAWITFLERNLIPDTPLENGAPPGVYTVTVEFYVEKDGSISELKALNNPDYGTMEEAIRVIKLGKWQPASQNGRFVRYRLKQPITFKVSAEKD